MGIASGRLAAALLLGLAVFAAPADAKLIHEQKFDDVDGFGPIIIRDNKRLGKKIMIQALEIPRFDVITNKYTDSEGILKVLNDKMLRGFKVYELGGPLPKDWQLLAEVTTDPNRRADERPSSTFRRYVDVLRRAELAALSPSVRLAQRLCATPRLVLHQHRFDQIR